MSAHLLSLFSLKGSILTLTQSVSVTLLSKSGHIWEWKDALIIMLGQQAWTRSVPNKLEFMVAVLEAPGPRGPAAPGPSLLLPENTLNWQINSHSAYLLHLAQQMQKTGWGAWEPLSEFRQIEESLGPRPDEEGTSSSSELSFILWCFSKRSCKA